MSEQGGRGAPCVQCGERTLRAREAKLTEKRRVKFGAFWVVATILTGGLALLVWLMMPRRSVVVGVDRFTECGTCGARQ